MLQIDFHSRASLHPSDLSSLFTCVYNALAAATSPFHSLMKMYAV